MSIKDFHDRSWCAQLKRIHQEMILENEFWDEVSSYHQLTEDDILDMGEQFEADQQIRLAGCDDKSTGK